MLYEFAITPDVFDSAIIDKNPVLRVTVIEILRGLCENGLVANLHKDAWVPFVVKERVDKVSPHLRDKILACLKLLQDRNRLVRRPRSSPNLPTSDLDWLMLALDEHRRSPFHGIVLTEQLQRDSAVNEDCVLGLSTVLDSSRWLDRKRTLYVTRTASDYRRELAPILRYARSLTLIDPYLDSDNPDFLRTLDICSDLLGRRAPERLKGRVHIHAHRDNQKADFSDSGHLDKWEIALKPLAQRDGHRFKVFLWRVCPGGEAFHDRFLITNQCGISIQAGLSIPMRKTPGSTPWALLDEEVRLESLNKVDPTTRTFQLVGEPLIIAPTGDADVTRDSA